MVTPIQQFLQLSSRVAENPNLAVGELRKYGIKANRALHSLYDERGVNIISEEWDNLLILDGCRYDMYAERESLDRGQLERRTSKASTSQTFIDRNFNGRDLHDTVYVTANPFVKDLDEGTFHAVYDMFDAWDEDLGTVLPGPVAERARNVQAEHPDKRLIVHFMQPHGPLIGSDESVPFDSDEAYWRAYTETLEHVLPYAVEVADAIRGKTVLTADHGQINYDGVWRHLGLKSHKPRLRLPGLVEVPWAVLEDERRQVTTEAAGVGSQDNVKDRLRDLGYVT